MMNKHGRHPLSFMEALEAELRKEIREEVAKEFAIGRRPPQGPNPRTLHAHEALELWLSARVETKVANITRTAAFSGYAHQAAVKSEHIGHVVGSVTNAVAEAVSAAREFMSETVSPRAHELDAMDIAALEFFRRNGVGLNSGFAAEELKSAYRKLALKFHPDRHVDGDELTRTRFAEMFHQVTEQTKRLSRHVSPAAQAAA
jgi:hypothetical protein